MGCDAYANENGEFEITVFSYDEPNNLKKVYTICGIGYEPKERLQVDWNKGDLR